MLPCFVYCVSIINLVTAIHVPLAMRQAISHSSSGHMHVHMIAIPWQCGELPPLVKIPEQRNSQLRGFRTGSCVAMVTDCTQGISGSLWLHLHVHVHCCT